MGSSWAGGVPDQVMVSAVVPQAAQVAQHGRRKHGPFTRSPGPASTQEEITVAGPRGLRAETAPQLACDVQEEP